MYGDRLEASAVLPPSHAQRRCASTWGQSSIPTLASRDRPLGRTGPAANDVPARNGDPTVATRFEGFAKSLAISSPGRRSKPLTINVRPRASRVYTVIAIPR